jgi:hypothetical protein
VCTGDEGGGKGDGRALHYRGTSAPHAVRERGRQRETERGREGGREPASGRESESERERERERARASESGRARERHAPTKYLSDCSHAPGNTRTHSAPYAPGELSYLPLHHSADTAATADHSPRIGHARTFAACAQWQAHNYDTNPQDLIARELYERGWPNSPAPFLVAGNGQHASRQMPCPRRTASSAPRRRAPTSVTTH